MISQSVSGLGLCTIKAGAAEETGSILCMIQPPSGCPGLVIRLLRVGTLALTVWCMSSTVMGLQEMKQFYLGLPQDCILCVYNAVKDVSFINDLTSLKSSQR